MHRIPLSNTEFEGHNNAYLLDGDGHVALIDTGVATPGTRRGLERGLAERGYAFADVQAVLLTHWHPDHAGLAGDIQAAGGATVYAHERDAPVIRQDPDALESLRDTLHRAVESWGMPESAQEPLLDRFDGAHRLAGTPPTVESCTDGEQLEVGGRRLRVLHAPGHTAGLCCYTGDGEAFVGDAVLPGYTPNIGGADVRVEHPLATYLESLRRIDRGGFEQLYPGHRAPIGTPTARIEAIIDHHRERLGRVVAVLRDGPADAWTVSAGLFGDLEGIHVLHGPGEAFAHLDHLEQRGIATRRERAYRLVEEPPRPDDVL